MRISNSVRAGGLQFSVGLVGAYRVRVKLYVGAGCRWAPRLGQIAYNSVSGRVEG